MVVTLQAPIVSRDEELHWLALKLVPGLGTRISGKLLERFRTPQAIFRASRTELEAAGVLAVADRDALAGYCQAVADLASLSERHEAVLRAKYLEQHSVADIAAEWDETPKAVESLLSRARAAFREAYQLLE